MKTRNKHTMIDTQGRKSANASIGNTDARTRWWITCSDYDASGRLFYVQNTARVSTSPRTPPTCVALYTYMKRGDEMSELNDKQRPALYSWVHRRLERNSSGNQCRIQREDGKEQRSKDVDECWHFEIGGRLDETEGQWAHSETRWGTLLPHEGYETRRTRAHCCRHQKVSVQVGRKKYESAFIPSNTFVYHSTTIHTSWSSSSRRRRL